MSSRSYLSIGDVLTLLREEFPDVTISKIRFLESQGLVNPERSPSGYRKFFEHDVERLRWVLRQQREHFLPLKVIRDRLADGDLDDDGPHGVDGAGAPTPEPAAPDANGRRTEPAHAATAGRHAIGARSAGPAASAAAATTTSADADVEQLTKADNEAMARILADASRRTARMPDAPPSQAAADEANRVRARGQPGGEQGGRAGGTGGGPSGAPAAATAPTPRPAPGAGPTNASTRKDQPTAAPTPPSTKRGGATSAPPTVPAPAPASASAPAAAAAGAAPAATSGAKSGPARSQSQSQRQSAAMVTGASLTADELCSASGLSEIELASLHGFGLIESLDVAGIATYDEDALTVANIAAELRVFGIEPRHLRLYKNAVDREIGLIEQVIIPLLRQRNPESRQRAIDSAEQLGALGQNMRATLLRSALRQHLGG